MKHINVKKFKEEIEKKADAQSTDFINVCTPAEYKEKHIEGVRNVPLDDLENRLEEFNDKQKIYIHCLSGKRTEKAIALLKKRGITAELISVSGGLMAWEEEGMPVNSKTTRIPIMRQVLITAGFLVAIGIILSWTVSQYFIYLSLFVGAGLVFAGLTGWCGMTHVLAKMPWNK